MNYSKDSRAQQEQKNNPKKKQKKKKGKVMAFRIIIMAIIIGLFAIVGGGLGVVIGIIKSTPDASTLSIKPMTNYTSFVQDADGNQIDTFSTADNRIYASLSEIPENLQHAVVALEDERFYQHNGIDIKGIFRAIFINLKNGSFSEGASTITQQLVKNNILTSEKKITRKIQEQYLAIEFEKLYPKDVILEYYLNTIALGQGVSGVQSAANRYFGKDVGELSLTECAVIAVITQRPTYYNPILNPENNWTKVKLCLDKMYEQGYITEAERTAALAENPYDNIQAVHKEFVEKSPRSYFVDTVLEEVINDLQSRLGYTSTQASNEVYGGGLTIKTTMDSRMQQIVDEIINDESIYPSSLYELQLDYSVSATKADGSVLTDSVRGTVKSEDDVEAWRQEQLAAWGITDDQIQRDNMIKQPQPQAAFVLTDYRTGQVKALAGGRGDKTNRGFNFATQAERQPGSTFKVLAAYAPAIDLGKLSPGSLLNDEPISIKIPGQKDPYSPKNWDGKYIGPTTVRKAIYHSMNVLAVKTVKDIVGVDTAFDYLQNFGFTTLVDSDRVYALPLGGITNGVTALELNAAYGTIANDGLYVKPIFYTQVLDSSGNVLLDNTSSDAMTKNSHSVIKASTAQMLTDMMQDVITVGTGGRIRSYFTSQPVAGKTGTTTDTKDLVFAGYTPYYAATIWTGYDQPKPINGANNYHLVLWSKIMNAIHEGLPYKSFPNVESDHANVQELKICSLSGKLATALCDQDSEHVPYSELFTSGDAPKEYCDQHVEIEICTVSGKIANEYCPDDTKEKVYKVLSSPNGQIPTEEICNVHGPDSVITPLPEMTPIPEEDPDVTIPGLETPIPEETPVATPIPPTDDFLPPAIENPLPNPDDEDGFFVPQE